MNFYITTAVDYTNGMPHIGHAYEKVVADAIARFKRCDGYNVHFLTGTDEYGLKILQTAALNNTDPEVMCEKNAAIFRKMSDVLNISYDDFVRTTENRHHRVVNSFWRKLEASGDIYKGTYNGWYSVRDEAYLSELETEVGTDGIRRSINTGTVVDWVKEESYFFRLSKYQDRLLKHYTENPGFIHPASRHNEVISFVQSGLADVSVSRTKFAWGIPVPDDSKHVLYVWLDALANYLTGVDFLNEVSPKYQTFWPANLHVIGKDVVRFHAVYWPAFLMSAGLPLPERVFSHGFILSCGSKMSKSLGNVVDPFELVNSYGVDPIRFFFLRDVPLGQDGTFSREAVIRRMNSDLANELGNLVHRALTMINKNCHGILPAPHRYTTDDRCLLEQAELLLSISRIAYDAQEIHKALNATWAVLSMANKYFTIQAPWSLYKTDFKRMETVLYTTVEVIRKVSLLLQPVIPTSSHKILGLLGQGRGDTFFTKFGIPLEAGLSLPTPSPVFQKL